VKTSDAGGGSTGGVFSIMASVPLFDRSQAERVRAEARERQARATLDWRRAEQRASITAARANVLRRRDAVSAYRAEAVSRADELRRIALVSYDAGERSILELVDAYQCGLSARLRLVDLETAVALAEIDLEYLSGWETVR
jgi:outer membrane protein TolC